MSRINHIVTEQPGVSIHREVPAKRQATEFDVSQMSGDTRSAWRKVCVDGGATPEDYRKVLESIMNRAVVEAIVQ